MNEDPTEEGTGKIEPFSPEEQRSYYGKPRLKEWVDLGCPSSEPDRVYGGCGTDDDLTAFGDTIATINRMMAFKKPKIPKQTYILRISHSVKLNAEVRELEAYKVMNNPQYYEIIYDLIKNDKDLSTLNEWELIERLYPNYEMIEDNDAQKYLNGRIFLTRPDHSMIATNLTLSF